MIAMVIGDAKNQYLSENSNIEQSSQHPEAIASISSLTVSSAPNSSDFLRSSQGFKNNNFASTETETGSYIGVI